MNGIREFLQSTAGKVTGFVLLLVAIFLIVVSIKSNFGPTESIAGTQQRIFVCSETKKSFPVAISSGLTIPTKSPFSGQNTGYPYDEICGWTAAGKPSTTPTYVLMNRTLKKSGPTFCPECGRLVVDNNPSAEDGVKPPPTEAEWKRQSGESRP